MPSIKKHNSASPLTIYGVTPPLFIAIYLSKNQKTIKGDSQSGSKLSF